MCRLILFHKVSRNYLTWIANAWSTGPFLPCGWLVIIFSRGKPTLRWRHNDHAGVSNHQPHGCLLNRLFRRKSKKTSKLRVTGHCAGNSPGPVNFPHKWPVTRKMFPFDDVIMNRELLCFIHKRGTDGGFNCAWNRKEWNKIALLQVVWQRITLPDMIDSKNLYIYIYYQLRVVVYFISIFTSHSGFF